MMQGRCWLCRYRDMLGVVSKTALISFPIKSTMSYLGSGIVRIRQEEMALRGRGMNIVSF